MRIKQFLQDRRGNVAPIFAIALIPIVGGVGAAVDYSRAASSRTDMQAALDATALMLSKEAGGLTATQITQKGTDYFNAMYRRPEARNIVITSTYTTTGGTQLTVSGKGKIDTSFTKVLGLSEMTFGSSSTVKWGNTKLRVALALDNTGSMSSSNKMSALKTATKQLLTTLQAAAVNPGDVQVSIVPFARDVNMGKSNYAANWINWSEWDDENGHDETEKVCTSKKTESRRSARHQPPGFQTTTIHGTAASPIATRKTTSRTPRRWPVRRRRCSSPNRMTAKPAPSPSRRSAPIGPG